MDKASKPEIFRLPPVAWGAVLVAVGLLLALFYPGLSDMVKIWTEREEYGHGFLLPVIAAFLLWQKKDVVERLEMPGSWGGLGLALFGLVVFFAGSLSSIFAVIQYGFVFTLLGLVWSFVGWRVFRVIMVPLALLFFMIPLPVFLYRGLSAALQLVSTEIGVWVIRLFDISVYVEGNVIDLGNYKLQVVEACSGLRYLFPLTSLAFIAAYLFKGALWKKLVIFFSSIPITVFMNSFRIGMIGVLVEHWGIEQAEGFLHDFEGWVVFMACIGILILEMWFLARIGPDRKSLADVFAIDFPEPPPRDAKVIARPVPMPFYIGIGFLALAMVGSLALGQREEVVPERPVFAEFPVRIGDWQGDVDRLESIYLDVLKLDDYLLVNYARKGDPALVNFYVAYYASQRAGESIHSPRSCIPGGGWKIGELSVVTLPDVEMHGMPVRANRVVISKGEAKQVVYYWFQGRGRNLTDEYETKFYLLWDAINMNRTDGALIRLTTPVMPGEDEADADRRLVEFARAVLPELDSYIPD